MGKKSQPGFYVGDGLLGILKSSVVLANLTYLVRIPSLHGIFLALVSTGKRGRRKEDKKKKENGEACSGALGSLNCHCYSYKSGCRTTGQLWRIIEPLRRSADEVRSMEIIIFIIHMVIPFLMGLAHSRA